MSSLSRLLKSKDFLVKLLLVLILFLTVCGFCLTYVIKSSEGIALEALYLMYNFEDLDELNENHKFLGYLLDKSLWEEYSLNNDVRVLSAYRKFYDNGSRVKIVYLSDNLILYKLDNKYINPDRIFVFEYRVNQSKIDYLKEYELLNYIDGFKGVVNFNND